MKGRPDETEDFVQIYVPMAQDPVDDIFLIVRPASGRAEALAPAVRAAIGRIDKEQLVSVRDVMTLEDVAWDGDRPPSLPRGDGDRRSRRWRCSLAMVGVFGILAYSVQQRVRDFGVRRALGATTGDVLRLVVGSAARVVATGAASACPVGGLRPAARHDAVRRPAAGSHDVRVRDVLLVVTAALAIAGPAWRATRIDPAVALRSD